MAYAESGTFSTDPFTGTDIKVFNCIVNREVPFLDTTGSGDTTTEWTEAGLANWYGTFSGWAFSTWSTTFWTDVSGTLALTVTNGPNLSGAARLVRLRSDLIYNSSTRKLVPLSCRFRYSGTVAIS